VRIVVLFPGALGDLCLLAPALASVAAAGGEVALSVQRSLQPIAPTLLPGCVLGPPMDGAVLSSLFADEPAPALTDWLRGADRVHAWLARGDRDGVLRARLQRLGAAVELHAVPRDDADRHAGDDYGAALGCAPAPDARGAPSLTLPPVSQTWPWRGPSAGRVVLHPGSGAVAKRWEADGFRDVADAVRASGGEPLVLLGPAEADEAPAWRRGGCDVVDALDVVAAAALIASAPSWVGNDSGVSHLAGALGRRGVVLFGPTRPARWRPRGGHLVPVVFAGRHRDDVTRDIVALLRAADAVA
jgi:hypothetical protein